MKNPPTLADACVVSALDRKAWGGSDERSAAIRQVLLMLPKARKFVLDVSMSRYLADMTLGYFRGGQRQRIHTLDNLRRLARLPHALTWIELDCSIWRNRLAELSGSAEHRGDPYRFGGCCSSTRTTKPRSEPPKSTSSRRRDASPFTR